MICNNTKEQLKKTGIYKIINKINGNTYYGSTATTFEKRQKEHINDLNKNRHKNEYLQHSYTFYGADNFEFSIVLIVEEAIYNPTLKDETLMYEQMCLDLYWDNCQKCYNINPIASSCKNRICSEETKEKKRKARLGKKHSIETRLKMSNTKKGKLFSLESRKKRSESYKGEGNPFFGKKHTNNAKQKISMAKAGKAPTIAFCQMMSAKLSGENSPSSKLMWKEVEEIRTKYASKEYSLFKLAKEYNVSKKTILNIIHNKTWKINV